LFGWKPKNLIGKNGWNLIHPEDIERIQKEFRKILKKETTSLIEYRFKCKEGNYKWIELTAINRVNDPAINGVLINYHDITEKKQTEEELKKHREQLEVLVDKRTAELKQKNKNLEEYNDLFIGREFRIKELREELKKLKK